MGPFQPRRPVRSAASSKTCNTTNSFTQIHCISRTVNSARSSDALPPPSPWRHGESIPAPDQENRPGLNTVLCCSKPNTHERPQIMETHEASSCDSSPSEMFWCQSWVRLECWDVRPARVVESSSADRFKVGLDTHWAHLRYEIATQGQG